MTLIRHWLARIGAAFRNPSEVVSGLPPPSSHVIARPPAEEILPEPTAIPTVVALDEAHHNGATSPIVLTEPNQQEINRRRDLVRGWFNDFWSERDDKPASFVDRLNEAETYINDRLTASGEAWQLDAEARATLSLPSRRC